MQKYSVGGMSCAACSARVEKAVSGLEGVTECSVNLLTNSMTVSGEASNEAIISAVRNAGYDAKIEEDSKSIQDTPNAPENRIKSMVLRLTVSSFFLWVLMYFSMGHAMWNFPLPSFFESNPIAQGLTQLLLTTAILIVNRNFFISGTKAVIRLSPNMDTLVSMGAAVSYVYSIFILFKMTVLDTAGAMHCIHELYFESAAMILTLITVGKTLEEYSKGKTTGAIHALLDLAPKTACVLKEGKEIIIPASELSVGDIFILRSGAAVPADGKIIEGSAAIDESAITGESVPAEKTIGDTVAQASVSRAGFLKCEVTRESRDSTVSQIVKIVSDAAGGKAPVSRLADKVSGVFVPVVIVIALITLAIWLAMGNGVGFAVARSVSVLVISCPCALGLATPVAIMVGSGVGAKRGILFKTAAALENAGRIKTVVLDKTGTVTTGAPKITDIIPEGDFTAEGLLALAASVESLSEHPIASAIVMGAEESGIKLTQVTDFKTLAGSGITAKINGEEVAAGNINLINGFLKVSENERALAEKLSSEGKTPTFFALNGQVVGVIAVADSIRPDSADAIKLLKKMGLGVVMLTGDRYLTALKVAEQVGIDDVIAEVLPSEKANKVSELSKFGAVAMVGDGINDAPALATADIGIAIGAGTDIAIDTADVVLMKSSLFDVAAAVRLSRKTLKNIKENLFWAFIYNLIGVPIAAGVFISVGLTLNPMLAAAFMSLSSFCVVTNALRLNLMKFKVQKSKKEELNFMNKTMKITGMMCGHCSGRVKQVLEALDGVTSANVSHETGTASLTMDRDISNDVLKTAVEEQGYTVNEII